VAFVAVGGTARGGDAAAQTRLPPRLACKGSARRAPGTAVAFAARMLRLRSERTELATVVWLHGRLDADHVAAVAAAATETGMRPLVLDVAGVAFADAAGVRCLRALQRDGAELRGATTFLRHLLETEP
jgi:hypothetical protein